jgi:uncharacterized membrane protein
MERKSSKYQAGSNRISPPSSASHTIAALTQRNIDLINQMEQAADGHRGAGEHFADVITRLAGSVQFVYWHIAWFGLWVAYNALPVVPESLQFDPYPFTFLTFVVSLEAIFLSTFILISQNHENQLSQQRSHLDLQINLLSEQENSRMLAALARLEERLGIPVEKDLATLQEEIRPDELSEQIERTQQNSASTHSKGI